MPLLFITGVWSPPIAIGNESSWNKSVDCCSWKRVFCDNVTGDVISLDLTYSRFHETLYSNGSLLLPKLQVLEMSNCELIKFPYFLNSLKTLTYLDLSSNKISGEIPRWFWGISHHTLEHLDLSTNLLEGVIQQLHWKRLLYVGLQQNSLQGPLPIISPSTRYFYANNNGFTGENSSSICQASSLLELHLSNNNLSGTIPQCFCNLTKLLLLDLSNNSLSGTVSSWFGNITYSQLYYLDLRSNNFHGRINLTACELSFPSLRYLLISNNNFIGWWPTNVFSNTSLSVIDLSNNKFEGPIPLPSPVTMYYSIANNVIIGRIPSLICNATNLEIINLSNNSLHGSLPWCLTNFSTDLLVLNLGMNHLEGTVPQTIALIHRLTTLDLSRNRFEGTLPRSLLNCTDLEILDLSVNQMEDTFPTWLGKLPELKVLILRSNNLKGPLNIPKGDLIFTELRILDLSNNNFCGPLPANLIMNLEGMKNIEDGRYGPSYMTQNFLFIVQVFGQVSGQVSGPSYENSVTVMMKGTEIKLEKILTIFTTIDLSYNLFQGDIPEVFGHLRYLIGLNLSHNHLTSSIPLTLGNLTNLEWLDLSSNMLSGRIPRALGDLTYLGYLNLSKNRLTGRIPQDKQLSTFLNDSFSGNLGLCGTPLSKACLGDAQPPPPSSSSTLDREGHESWFKQKVVWMGYASGIIIGISIAYIAIQIGWPKWLARGVRMLERSAIQWMEKPKWRAIKFHGQ
ncbi:hypothetical protein EUGRSUZ_F00576 [Eucalyptus grandis]|uniref:Uncharacterized protein n=2 Tax=Eucalyptus grandis TaxID=71139 RepID=A0ACC3KCI6_EUCGR|nr:hypothetical protein EUGRSUZ_F00576 [Eucalyptus grandis]